MLTLGNFISCFPFDDALTRFTITGGQLKRIFAHVMRPENRDGEGECYQVNRGVRAVYNEATRELESLEVRGKPVDGEALYTLVLQGYHVNNASVCLNVTYEELAAHGKPKVVSTSVQDVLEEFFRDNQNLNARVEGRLVYTA